MMKHLAPAVFLAALLSFAASVAVAGQMERREREDYTAEASAKLVVPANLPPLTANWAQLLYDQLDAKARRDVRFLFLDAPVPCNVTIHSKIPFSKGKKEYLGYGGMLAMRARGWVGSDMLNLYVIDASGQLLLYVDTQNLGSYAVNPLLFRISSESKGGSTVVSTYPLCSIAALQRLTEFRKEKFESLQPYAYSGGVRDAMVVDIKQVRDLIEQQKKRQKR